MGCKGLKGMQLSTISVKPKQWSPWPYFESDEIAAATAVLASGKVNYWTGQEGRQFEAEFAAYCGTSHAIALTNGTVAIELALKAAGVGPGDEVIVTPRSFMASASSPVIIGARPVFADVDRDSGNLTATTIERVLTPNTKAVILVHLAGWACDMHAIMDLAKERDLLVIEDCAQAHGATYHGRRVGSIGHVNTWSFCQDKIMTTCGEGGMITTNDPELADFCWSYKDHGKSYDAVYHREHQPGYRWLHEDFGTNWRMIEVQAAMGRIALEKLNKWSDQRQQHAGIYQEAFRGVDGLRVPIVPSTMRHAYYRFYGYIQPDSLKSGWSRDRIMQEINAQGVPCFVGSCSELYREKAFVDAGLAPSNPLPVAKELGETSLSWLLHPTLSEEEVRQMAEVSRSVIVGATR